MEYINGVSSLYIRKFARKVEQYNKLAHLPEYFGPMIGDKKHVRIAEVGAGPINTIGTYWDGCKVEVIASDVLAEEYKKLWEQTEERQWVPVEYQDIEALSYPDESFDIVHCVNALDHTKDARKALNELRRICKKDGYVYLRHAENQKTRFGGHHYWDARYINQGCQFHADNEIMIYDFDCFKTHIEDGLIVSIWQKI